MIQRRVAVTAGVKFFVTVQPAVHEVTRRDVLQKRPFPCGVGEDKCDAMLSQQLDEPVIAEAFMTNLECVTQPTAFVGLEMASTVQTFVMCMGEMCGRFGIARE